MRLKEVCTREEIEKCDVSPHECLSRLTTGPVEVDPVVPRPKVEWIG